MPPNESAALAVTAVPVDGERPILIVGLPRSGTTWTQRVLGSAPRIVRVAEPDNEDKYPEAIYAKQPFGRYPSLAPGQDAPHYRRLWEWILSGAPESRRTHLARKVLGPGAAERVYDGHVGPQTWLGATLARNPVPSRSPGGRVIVKSIHAQLSLEWIADEFDVTPLVLLRHPANVLASWKELKLKDGRNPSIESREDIRARFADRWGVPMPGPDPIERMSWRIGLLNAALEESIGRHPEWHIRTHEQLCTDSEVTFRALYGELGLEWSEAPSNFLVQSNVPGDGFVPHRVASELSESWTHRLDDHELATLRRVLSQFPIRTWSGADFERP